MHECIPHPPNKKKHTHTPIRFLGSKPRNTWAHNCIYHILPVPDSTGHHLRLEASKSYHVGNLLEGPARGKSELHSLVLVAVRDGVDVDAAAAPSGWHGLQPEKANQPTSKGFKMFTLGLLSHIFRFRWSSSPQTTHPCPIFETEVGQEP